MRAVIAAVQNQEEADKIVAEYHRRSDVEVVFFNCQENKLTVVFELIEVILESFDICKTYSDKVINAVRLNFNKVIPLLKKKGCTYSSHKGRYELFKNEVKVGTGKNWRQIVKTLWLMKDAL